LLHGRSFIPLKSAQPVDGALASSCARGNKFRRDAGFDAGAVASSACSGSGPAERAKKISPSASALQRVVNPDGRRRSIAGLRQA
jgi:hypothetical protein